MYTLNDLLREKKIKESLTIPDYAFDFAKAIIDARLAAGFSQEQLAKKLGTKQSAIARLESGNHIPSNKTLIKIAQALGTKLIPSTFESIDRVEVYAGVYQKDFTSIWEVPLGEVPRYFIRLAAPNSTQFSEGGTL